MRAKSLILLMLALGCGLVAAIGITQVMAKRTTQQTALTMEMQPVLVAALDLPMGDLIKAEALKIEEWPKGKVPAGALSQFTDVEDRRPKSRIYAGSPILDNQLLGKGQTEASVTNQIPKGFRVVAVKVDDVSGTASLVRPGDRVAVLVHLARNPSKGIDVTSTRTLLQDIKVFAVDQTVELEPDEDSGTRSAKTVSLLVTPDQAEVVMLASELGKVRLVMRGLADDTVASVDGKTPMQLFGRTEGSVDRVAPPPEATKPSEDLLGFLQQQGGPANEPVPVVAPIAPPGETWTVRVLQASQVQEVVMAPVGNEDEKTKAEFSLWKTISSTSIGNTPSAGADSTSSFPTSLEPPVEAPETTPPEADGPVSKDGSADLAEDKQGEGDSSADN